MEEEKKAATGTEKKETTDTPAKPTSAGDDAAANVDAGSNRRSARKVSRPSSAPDDESTKKKPKPEPKPKPNDTEPEDLIQDVKVGDRIEVKWELTDKATNQAKVKWWGCKIDDKVLGSKFKAYKGKKHVCYSLTYDSYDDFEESTVDVVFLSDNKLYDCAMKAIFSWVKEGEEKPTEEDHKSKEKESTAKKEKPSSTKKNKGKKVSRQIEFQNPDIEKLSSELKKNIDDVRTALAKDYEESAAKLRKELEGQIMNTKNSA